MSHMTRDAFSSLLTAGHKLCDEERYERAMELADLATRVLRDVGHTNARDTALCAVYERAWFGRRRERTMASLNLAMTPAEGERLIDHIDSLIDRYSV